MGGPPGFWHAALGPAGTRPALAADTEADVCIVGAGYTGLWTAWALLGADPALRVVVLEAYSAGFGASGRNGGWLSGLMPGVRERMAAGPAGRAGVVSFQEALRAAVGEVVDICAAEGIDADIRVGGTLSIATNAAQARRLRAAQADEAGWGVASEWLSSAAVAERVAVAGAAGAVWNPDCARIQPAKLARGLAAAAERRGARVHEGSPAATIEPGRVITRSGVSVVAPWVVVATEGWTATLPGRHRRLLPLNSSMIVTRPLPPAVWTAIGWSGAETLSDGAHAYVYLQRTADDRIAIGGRGVPYRWGSVVDPSGRCPSRTVEELRRRLVAIFPVLGDAGVTGWRVDDLVEAGWSGVLGVARDWCPAVEVSRTGSAGGRGGGGGRGGVGSAGGGGDSRSGGGGGGGGGGGRGGVVSAGGYVGDGVATSYLAGRTMADIVLGRDTERTALPWVGWRSRPWEPEPLRWLGVRSVYALYRAADRLEAARPASASTSVLARAAGRIAGR